MTRHVGNLHLRPSPLADIFVGRHPAPARHRLIDHCDRSPVVQLDVLAGRRARFYRGEQIVDILARVSREGPAGDPLIDKSA